MNYLHCPTCKRAYNFEVQATCPWCPVAATVVDPADDIVAAAQRLSEAMARATPAERTAAAVRIQHLQVFTPAPPPIAPPPPAHSIVVSIAMALERRLARRMPKLLGDGLRRVRDRVRALAA
jgi:hypothetical protein